MYLTPEKTCNLCTGCVNMCENWRDKTTSKNLVLPTDQKQLSINTHFFFVGVSDKGNILFIGFNCATCTVLLGATLLRVLLCFFSNFGI